MLIKMLIGGEGGKKKREKAQTVEVRQWEIRMADDVVSGAPVSVRITNENRVYKYSDE